MASAAEAGAAPAAVGQDGTAEEDAREREKRLKKIAEIAKPILTASTDLDVKSLRKLLEANPPIECLNFKNNGGIDVDLNLFKSAEYALLRDSNKEIHHC
jgi:hypothetical protein